MAKVKEDISRVRLIVDGKQGINELGKLEMEAKELAIDIKNAKKGTEEYVNANKKLKEVKSQITGVRKELGLTGMTLGQLTRYQTELKKEMRTTTTRGTENYRRLRKELDKVNNAVRTQRAELNGTKGFFAGMGRELKAFGVMALGALGATAFFGQIQSMIDGSAKLSDALSDVQKTTNLTGQEVDRLAKNLKAFDTRTPRSELLGLAEVAGRLGIKGVKDIEGFVRAADMINVSLGDVLGDPEKVMKDLGKLTETFGVKDAFGIEDSLLRVGSAINELGMASTANEGYMVEFSKRMGGIAPLAKITIQDILGLGATLDSLGQTAEVSTTALSKVFISMAKNADVYAKYAGMQVTDFVKLLNEDANEAFIRTLEGVKDNSAGITELSKTLGDLGENGGRVVGVLGSLANNTEKLRAQQDLANTAFQEGSSVVDEFAIKNENFAANLGKVQKWLAQMFVNSAIMNGLNTFVETWADWIKIPVSETIEAERIELQKLHARIISTNTDTEERKKLINELKRTYPDYLGQINADTVSNEGLSLAIKGVNDQLMNKIILQKQDEEIMENTKLLAEQQTVVWEQEDKIYQKMIGLAEKHNITLKEGISIQEQATIIANEAAKRAANMDISTAFGNPQAAAESIWNLLANPGANATRELLDDVDVLQSEMKALNNVEQENNTLLDEKTKLMERLGIVMDKVETPVTPKVDPEDPDAPGGGDEKAAEEAAKKAAEERRKAAEEEYKKLVGEFKKYQDQIAKLEEDHRVSLLDRDSQEIAKVEAKYEPMLAQAREYHSKKLITDEEFSEQETSLLNLKNQEIDALIAAHSDKIKEERQKLLSETELLQMTAEEQELEKVRRHFNEKIEEYKKFGLQTIELEKVMNSELDQIRSDRKAKEREDITQGYDELIQLAQQHNMPVVDIEKAKIQALLDLNAGYGSERIAQEIAIAKQSLESDIKIAQAKIEIQKGISQTIGHAIDFIGNKSGELTTFQKGLTLAQIAIDTAASLAKIVPLALDAADDTGPAAPFVFAAYLASMTATVFGAIAKAKNALSGSDIPKWNSSGGIEGEDRKTGRGAMASAAPVSSYYKGGDTSGQGMGIGDRYGEFTGYVHKDEYVVPSFIRSHPYVADVLPAIEAIRQDKIRGFYKGGDTANIPKSDKKEDSSMGNQRIEYLLEAMLSKMDTLPTRIKAYLVDSEVEEFRAKRDMLKKKYVK